MAIINPRPACEHCRYCSLRSSVTAAATFVCRANPPRAFPMTAMSAQGPQIGVVTVWPEVQREDFCARFEPQLS